MNAISSEELSRLASARVIAFAAAELAHAIARSFPAGSDARLAAVAAASKLYRSISLQRYGLNF